MPGMITSETMQSNCAARSNSAKNASASVKQEVSRSRRAKYKLNESSTAASSSMSAMWIASCMAGQLYDWKGETHGAARRIAAEPQTAAMGLNDRSTQRKPNAETVGLRRCERYEGVGGEIPRKSRARIADIDLDEIAGGHGLDGNRPARGLADRLNR